MNPDFNIIRMLNSCFKLTGMVRLKQFVYGMLFGVALCNFFRLSSGVKLSTLICLTQIGGLEQMDLEVMKAILEEYTNMLSSVQREYKKHEA